MWRNLGRTYKILLTLTILLFAVLCLLENDLRRRVQYKPRGGRVICIPPHGRLGNQMFQFCAGYSLSKAYKATLMIHPDTDTCFREIFKMRLNSSRQLPYTVGSCDGMHTYTNLRRGFQREFFKLQSGSDLKLDGYFESWKYFDKDLSDILQVFTLTEDYNAFAVRVLQQQQQQQQNSSVGVTNIGIHIRRGDIEAQQPLAPWSFFLKAMAYYRKAFPRVHFFVASDKVDWCQEHFRDISDVTILRGSTFEDLAVLSTCDHNVVSVGTFGWWAAMMAGGQVVYYKHEQGTMPKYYTDADFFPPHWIPMTG